MQKFKMIRSAGHILLDYCGKNYVIDTGSPVSFSFDEKETIELNGKEFSLQSGMTGVNRQDIESLVNSTVFGFIGLDILTELGDVAIIWTDNAIVLGEPVQYEYSASIPISWNSMYVTVPVIVNGQTVSMLLDTGARIDYLTSQYLDLTQERQTELDFNPMLGEMEVDGYKTTYTIAEKDYSTVVYRQPEILEMMTGLLGVSGIIGMNVFFMAGSMVSINFKENRLEIIE